MIDLSNMIAELEVMHLEEASRRCRHRALLSKMLFGKHDAAYDALAVEFHRLAVKKLKALKGAAGSRPAKARRKRPTNRRRRSIKTR